MTNDQLFEIRLSTCCCGSRRRLADPLAQLHCELEARELGVPLHGYLSNESLTPDSLRGGGP